MSLDQLIHWIDDDQDAARQQLDEEIARRRKALRVLENLRASFDLPPESRKPAEKKATPPPSAVEMWTAPSGLKILMKDIRTMARYVRENPATSPIRVASNAHLGKDKVYEVASTHPWFDLRPDGLYLTAAGVAECPDSPRRKEGDQEKEESCS